MNDWLFPEEVIELIRQKAKELLLDFDTLADAVNRALGIVGYSMQEATEAFEKLFKQAEEQSIASVGTSPKKYGMSLPKRQNQVATHYNYIPRVPRNQPHQRRAY